MSKKRGKSSRKADIRNNNSVMRIRSRQRASFPELFVPAGFAGGLVDPDTGFARFGWRDYDPAMGRFTAPDPLGDTGGDHDLYEYCIE